MILSKDYIKVNGISSNVVGLYIDTPPMPPKAEQQYEEVAVPGREETLTIKQDTYSDIQIDIKAYVFDGGFEPKKIYLFINDAKTLITSSNANFYYKVKRVLGIIPEYSGHGKQFLTISFMCSPFKYSTDDSVETYDDGEFSVMNRGDLASKPIMKVYGSGTVQVKVNSTENPLILYNVQQYAEVNCEKLIAHKDGAFLKTKGKFPFLAVGENLFETNATKIEITKNERWL